MADLAPEGLSIAEIADQLAREIREHGIVDATAGSIHTATLALAHVYREFLTHEQRLSLEGVGLLKWDMLRPPSFVVPEVFLQPPWSLSEEQAWELVRVLLNTARSDRAVELQMHKGIRLSWDDLRLRGNQLALRLDEPKGNKLERSWSGRRTRRVAILKRLLEMRSPSAPLEETAVFTLRSIWERIGQHDSSVRDTERILSGSGEAKRLNPNWWRALPIRPEHTVWVCTVCGQIQSFEALGHCLNFRCGGALRAVQAHDLEPNHYRELYLEIVPAAIRVEEHTAQIDKDRARELQDDFKHGRIQVLSCSTTFELGVDLGDLDTILLRNVPPESFNYAQRVGRSGRRGVPGLAVTYCKRSPHDVYHFQDPERILQGKIQPPALTITNLKILTRHATATVLSKYFRSHPSEFGSVKRFFGDLGTPRVVENVRRFIDEHKADITRELKDIMPKETWQMLGLLDGTWDREIAGPESQLRYGEMELSGDYRAVADLEIRAQKAKDYNTAKWAVDRARTIEDEDVLSFLSRKAIIPKYGFPVDVVELDIHRKSDDESAGVVLQRDLSIAISEFAPTSEVIANKRVWKSHGLKKVAGYAWERVCYSRCIRHALFQEYRAGEAPPTEKCCTRMMHGEYIVPKFGFIKKRGMALIPQRRPSRVFSSRPYFVSSADSDIQTIDMPSNEPLTRITHATPGYMVVLCEGRRGRGFYICPECGTGSDRLLRTHKTALDEPCRGRFEEGLALGHKFVTDVVKVTLLHHNLGPEDPTWFAYSVGYALSAAAASVLSVPLTDLSATIAYARGGTVPPIVLYDNVPGGAGLVARLEHQDVFLQVLRAAYERVSGDCCGEETSCYACLRTYGNQFAHEHLKRGPVRRYIGELLDRWR
ncbi:MAG: helicase-related protein [Bacillota bacterium]